MTTVYQRMSQFFEFLVYLKTQFLADRCTGTAASLAYTTILALVPLLAVAFVTLSAFPAFQELGYDIQGFLFENFVPDVGFAVQDHLGQFAAQASQLRAVGIAFLIVTVLAMMSTIDAAFNQIWRIRTPRSSALSFLVYWAVLTLGPMLIGVGILATSYVVSLPIIAEVDSTLGLKARLLLVTPYLTTMLAFVLFYRFIPNTPVPMRNALIGGMVASVLFELAKRGFAFYVTNFPTQQAIYGAFGAVPIFLIWIYLSWIIVLLGAEIARCLTTFGTRSDVQGEERIDGLFEDSFHLVGRLWQARREGRTLSTPLLLGLEPQMGLNRMEWVLEHLHKVGWLQRTEEGEWILNRDLSCETLLDFMQVLPGYQLASAGRREDTPWARALRGVLERHRQVSGEVLQRPMRELFETNSGPTPVAPADDGLADRQAS